MVMVRYFSLIVLALGLGSCSQTEPVLKIGLVADPQYADKPVAGKRFYRETLWKLEEAIDNLNVKLKPLKEFILPGGHTAAAYCHLARSICRRAERHSVGLDKVNPFALQYLNRLSDYLFVAARSINQSHEIKDVMWQSEKLRRNNP